MRLHPDHVFGTQPTRFIQNGVRNAYFSYIMKMGGLMDVVNYVGIIKHTPSNHDRILRDPVRMLKCVFIPFIEDLYNHIDQLVNVNHLSSQYCLLGKGQIKRRENIVSKHRLCKYYLATLIKYTNHNIAILFNGHLMPRGL